MPEQTLQLRDIKPIVAVPDHSFWLFCIVIAAAVALLLLGAVLIVRRRKKRIDPKRTEALRRLNALDFNDTKEAVYDFSLLGHFVVTPETQSEFASILRELEPYKFKKEVPPLNEALRRKMQQFIQEARRG